MLLGYGVVFAACLLSVVDCCFVLWVNVGGFPVWVLLIY